MIKFGSLFSGIGGFDLGLERAGMKCLWQVEIDDYANRVLEKHWPEVKRYKDVREIGSHNLEPVDLICGGFPCQPHSLAGKRQASADKRDLWGEFARIIRELRPRYVVAENVPGLLSSESGRFFGRVLRDLAESGYDAEWQCIPASAFGAPHRRDRVWLIAYANSNGRRLQQISREESKSKATVEYDGQKKYLADSDSEWQLQSQRSQQEQRGWISDGSQDVAYANGPRRKGYWDSPFRGKAEYPMSSFSGWWEIEPDVGRVAHGVSAELDIIGRLENENKNNQKTITETQITIRRILFYVWENREIAKTSPDIYRTGLYNCVPEMPCSNSYGGWVMGSRFEKDKGLRDLWGIFYSETFNKAQDLLPKLLERIRAFERSQKMAAKRVDRLKCLGNAVVPQVVEWIGTQIIERNK